MRKPIAAVALIGIALVLVVTAGAGATRTVDVPSKVSIRSNGLRFHGRVTTGQRGCFQDRTVVLYKAVDGPDQSVGRSKTDDRGEWSVEVSGWAGVSLARFYAKVKRSSEGTAGTIYDCLPARSKTIKPGS